MRDIRENGALEICELKAENCKALEICELKAESCLEKLGFHRAQEKQIVWMTMT